jgi:hypothetical protein
MNIAVLIRGMSYSSNKTVNKSPINWGFSDKNNPKKYKKLNLDFMACYDNIWESLITPLRRKHKVDIYLSTYISSKFGEILNLTQPVKYHLNNLEKDNQISTVRNGLQLIENCDFVIVIRFDLLFLKMIEDFNLDFDKINFLWKEQDYWQIYNHVGDLMFAYPYEYNKNFINVCNRIEKGENLPHAMDFHFIYKCLQEDIGIDQIRFCQDRPYHTAQHNPFVSMNRGKVD